MAQIVAPSRLLLLALVVYAWPVGPLTLAANKEGLLSRLGLSRATKQLSPQPDLPSDSQQAARKMNENTHHQGRGEQQPQQLWFVSTTMNQSRDGAAEQTSDDSRARLGFLDHSDDSGSGQLSTLRPLMDNSNGTAILEDLVNQFLEKNSEAVRQSSEQAVGTNQLASHHQLSAAQMVEPSNNEANSSELDTTVITASTPLPFMQLVAMSSPPPAQDNIDIADPEDLFYVTREYQDQQQQQQLAIQQNLDDRHIQYDKMVENETDTQQTLSGNQLLDQQRQLLFNLEQQHVEGDNNKLSNYKTIDTNSVADNLTQSQASNYTLKVVRVHPEQAIHDSLRANSTLQDKPTTYGETTTADQQQQPLVTVIKQADIAQTTSNVSTSLTPSSSNSSSLFEPQAPVVAVIGVRNSQPAEVSHQQTVTPTRSSNIQARSMNNNMLIAKTISQHSRPPYATYDQFHHQADAAAQQSPSKIGDQTAERPSKSTNQTNNNNQTIMGGQDSAAIINTINLISSHLASDAARGGGTATGDAGDHRQQQSANSNNNNNKKHQHQPETVSREQQLMNDENRLLHKLASVNQLVDLNPIPAQEQQPSAHHRLGSLSHIPSIKDQERFYFSKENQLFSLFPHTQSGGSHSLDGNNRYAHVDHNTADQLFVGGDNTFPTNHPMLMTETSAGSSIKPALSLLPDIVERSKLNDLSGERNNLTDKVAHDSKNGAPESRYPDHSHISALHRKTLESLSNQLSEPQHHHHQFNRDNNDEVLKTLEANHHHHHHHQQQQSTGLLHPFRGSSSHYAASLVNVTAPMVLPLSATEAMESALDDQAAKSLLHQVSGVRMRSPQGLSGAGSPSSNNQDQSSIVHTTGRPSQTNQHPHRHQQSQYFMPQAPTGSPAELLQQHIDSSSSSQSIYSQPANQFSPKPLLPLATNVNQALDSITGDGTLSSNLSSLDRDRMRLDGNGYIIASRQRPYTTSSTNTNGGQNNNSLTHTHQASGFRSPLQQSTSQGNVGQQLAAPILWSSTNLPLPSNYLSGPIGSMQLSTTATSSSSSAATSATYGSDGGGHMKGSSTTPPSTVSATISQQDVGGAISRPPPNTSNGGGGGANTTSMTATGSTTNGFLTGGVNTNHSSSTSNNQHHDGTATTTSATTSTAASAAGLNRRVFNLTRVEHISAECSNDLIRTVIVFNGTFKGIIYSSGYVRDPDCMYINGTGKTRYDFSIRLNQCGTLGRQELHPPSGPNEVRRRDQVMWNTLSIQYNPIVEQEWDEHFRVSCEYGSDFWKTVSFSPFNVETNTGSPVVFTVDPPQCQMEILRGHGMVGPRQEAISGPVTVGDPLTLLIHMKSEKAGYDILVKNCIAHNGGHQKMQLIDSNGCVVNERFISPFRGTYNDNDLKHVTLYSYLKAFRFTGSPVLYLECEIHMCQSSCPPQMCYWRRLSKRSTSSNATNYLMEDHHYYEDQIGDGDDDDKADKPSFMTTTTAMYYEAGGSEEDTTQMLQKKDNNKRGRRQARKLNLTTEYSEGRSLKELKKTTTASAEMSGPSQQPGQISDKVSLFQALEVRQEREPDAASSYSSYPIEGSSALLDQSRGRDGDWWVEGTTTGNSLMCYRRAEVLAFLFTSVSVILVAISITIGCCWRAASLRHRDRKKLAAAASITSANLSNHSSLSSYTTRTSSGLSSVNSYQNLHQHHSAPSPYHKALNSMVPILGQQHSTRHKDRLIMPTNTGY